MVINPEIYGIPGVISFSIAMTSWFTYEVDHGACNSFVQEPIEARGPQAQAP
jgi:hypothetical protein